MDSKVALVRCVDYTALSVEQAIRQAISFLGGIDRFINPNSSVLIKPNLLMAQEPDTGIDTHPEFVRAVIHLLKDIDSRIYLGDSSSALHGEGEDIRLVWEKSGIKQIAEQEGVELVAFTESRWQDKFPLTNWLTKVDYLVSLPKLKTHNLTILTGAIKNLFGLIPGKYKIELHKRYFAPRDFAGMLVDLYEICRPALTIVDGILALEGDGPARKAERRELGLVAAGVDCVAIDSVLALIMGLKPEDILTTQEASGRNLGNAWAGNIQILGEELGSFSGAPFKLPKATLAYKIPRPVQELARALIRFYPRIDKRLCLGCQACIGICPQKAIKQTGDKISIDYRNCIACFCCQEACPAGAISTEASLLARLLRL